MDNNRIKNIKKQTNNKFLNLYEAEAVHRNGKISPYYIASRAPQIDILKISTKENTPDGVIIYAVHGEKKDKVVLIRQFRYPINDYIYEFPAGLVEPGENMTDCAVREMYEETGLHFEPLSVSNAYTKPYFTTVGMTDESCGTIYGYCSGTPTNAHQEAGEDIQIILADKEECKRILKEEKVAIMCSYMLMHFIHTTDNDPLAFLQEIE
ncbi:MAG: NUDIX hydrolase [Lachnospiraceae bacterium]|nr:NUDIX hydrolase [Lachnospiraceae bacterium]